MADLHIVILAAGQGKRMKSGLPKVLHRVAGVPMIELVLRAAAPLGARSTTIVVGHGADRVKSALADRPGVRFALQEPQRGTGDALRQAAPQLANATGTILLLSGDVPLLDTHTLGRLIETHQRTAAALTLLTARMHDPRGYGRVVRDGQGVARIVEERDASSEEKAIDEIKAGVYAFDAAPLFPALDELRPDNDQQELYLTDLVSIHRKAGRMVETVTVGRSDEIRGVNSRAELAEVSRAVRQRKNRELMAAGVTIEDPAVTYIDADVSVGADTVIKPCVFLEGRTTIGGGCEIHSGVRIVDSTIGDGVVIRNHSVITGARIAAGSVVGPFAHLRPDSELAEGAHVGNFVELKKTRLGRGSKANHLAYLGDATIGDRVNIGAGTITCNYDGRQKHPTHIGDEAFIGSDSQLVAPVRVGQGAYVASGSTITDDVPAGALAIARGRQVNKVNWVHKKKEKG
jgi:bifunctional UDP-N-acetylglucosamine pyrophosphorylase/glucosamine-1-phosphate N-acetyltransferase